MSPVLKKRISQQKIVWIFEEMYERPTIDMMGEDEGNMLYVALTRAKRNLIINDALFFLLTSCYINYSFENLEFCSNCEETNCMKCGMDWRGLERTGEERTFCHGGHPLKCGSLIISLLLWSCVKFFLYFLFVNIRCRFHFIVLIKLVI